MIDWLTQLVETGQVSYDPSDQTLTVTASLSESSLDKIIEEALTAAGYDASQITIDLVNGERVVTIQTVELSSQLSGTLQLTLALSVQDGQIVVSVSHATLNGIPIASSLVDDLIATIQAALGSLGVIPPVELGYTVESLTVTNDAIIITATVILPLD